MKILNIALLLVSVFSFMIISFLIYPARMNMHHYIYSVSWGIFLITLNWYVSTYVMVRLQKKYESTSFGVLPSLHLIIFIYSISSMLLVIIGWISGNLKILPMWHWFLQTVFFAISSIIVIITLMAIKTANIDSNLGLINKNYMINLIIQKQSLSLSNSSSLKFEIQTLLNTIKFFIPNENSIKNKNYYNKFVNEIENLNFQSTPIIELKEKINDLIIMGRALK